MIRRSTGSRARTMCSSTSADATSKAADATTICEHTSYRGVVGLRGDFARGVELRRLRPVRHDGLHGELPQRLLARTPAQGAHGGERSDHRTARLPRQRGCGPTNDDPKCVPYNIWQIGGVTPDALNYVQVPGFKQGQTDRRSAQRLDHRRPRSVRREDAHGQ